MTEKLSDDLRNLNASFEAIYHNIQNDTYRADEVVVQHLLNAQNELGKAMLKALEKK